MLVNQAVTRNQRELAGCEVYLSGKHPQSKNGQDLMAKMRIYCLIGALITFVIDSS